MISNAQSIYRRLVVTELTGSKSMALPVYHPKDSKARVTVVICQEAK